MPRSCSRAHENGLFSGVWEAPRPKQSFLSPKVDFQKVFSNHLMCSNTRSKDSLEVSESLGTHFGPSRNLKNDLAKKCFLALKKKFFTDFGSFWSQKWRKSDGHFSKNVDFLKMKAYIENPLRSSFQAIRQLLPTILVTLETWNWCCPDLVVAPMKMGCFQAS